MGDKDKPDGLKEIMELVSKYFDFKTGSFIVPIILYCIAFSQLFNHSSTEYLSWLLIMLLNCTFPFTWISELWKVVKNTLMKDNHNVKGNFLYFSFYAIVFTYILQFIVLLFVALKNESVRKGKERRGEYDDGKLQNIKTNDRTVEQRDKNISILLITTNVIIWVLTSSYFSSYFTQILKNENNINEKNQLNEVFPIGNRIYQVSECIPYCLQKLDDGFHYLMKYSPMSKFQNMLGVYCVTFIVILFSVFLRIKYKKVSTDPPRYEHSGYEVSNMARLFNRDFYANNHHYRNLAKFVVSLLISAVVFFILYVFLVFWDFLGSKEIGFLITIGATVLVFIITVLSVYIKSSDRHAMFESNEGPYFTDDVNINDISNVTINTKYTVNEPIKDVSLSIAIGKVSKDLYNSYFVYDRLEATRETNFSWDDFSNYTSDKWNWLEDKYRNMDSIIGNAENLDANKIDEFNDFMERVYALKSSKEYNDDRKAYANKYDGPVEYNRSKEFVENKRKYEQSSDYQQLKQFVFYILSVFFGILAAPVVIVLLEVIMPIVNKFINFYTGSKWFFEVIHEWFNPNTNTNTNQKFHISLPTFFGAFWAFLAILISLITYTTGAHSNRSRIRLIDNESSKQLQLFLAVMITMLISMFFALLTNFNMFSALWKIPSAIVLFFVKSFGPIAILIFTAICTYYSYKNYKLYRYRTSE